MASKTLYLEIPCAHCGTLVLRSESYLASRKNTVGKWNTYCSKRHQRLGQASQLRPDNHGPGVSLSPARPVLLSHDD